MRQTTIIILAVTAVLLLAGGAGALIAFDSSRGDTIAQGITVGDLDVGGLSAADAKKKIAARVGKRLSQPVVVYAGAKRFEISPRQAGLRADVDATVSAALRRGRAGSVFTRTWRALSGGEVDASVQPKARFSRAAVSRFVKQVSRDTERKPIDADISLAGQRVSVRRSAPGLDIDDDRLRARVKRTLTDVTSHRRMVRASLAKQAPKVTTARLARKYKTIVAVDRAHFRISLFKRLKRVKSYPIAIGQAGLETPAGRYTIQNKAVNPAWHVPNSPWAGSLAGSVIPGGAPNNPLKARWLGVYDGVGVHGTSARGSIGTTASHGCIRMLVEDVTQLYDQVPVGTPIFIS